MNFPTAYDCLTYRGSSGEVVELDRIGQKYGSGSREQWRYRTALDGEWSNWLGSKFDALLMAAHSFQKSGEEMDWIPIEALEAKGD